MPRFYIHFRNGDLLVEDKEGHDLTGLDEARALAEVSGREILADNIRFNAATPLTAIVIANEDGVEPATIPARDILPAGLQTAG
jgi:hypothetical protein